MSFPFIAPLKPWIKEKLENREKFSFENFRLSPFAILTSGAIVTKALKGEDIALKIKNSQYTENVTFKGCAISNQSEFSKLYSTSNTVLGYDLNGKAIVVDGEKDRKISPPIIQSIEIDTDGGNNTLKSARTKIKVFSLKQLEMFDLFFLRPSMNVILEYGWNTDIVSKTNIDSILFAKKKYDDYKTAFAELFDDAKIAKTKYLDNLKLTDGNYDYMAGKVTDFTYSPVEDGTYDIDLEISAGNELQLWMPMKQSNKDSTVAKKDETPKPPNYTPYQTWLRTISADFNIPAVLDEKALPKAEWESEFFNWDMMNAKEKDKVVSFDRYISFKLIKQLLQTSQIFTTSKDKLKINYFLNNQEIIPMNSDPFMISSTDDLIIPNKMPKFKFDTVNGKKNVLVIDPDEKNMTECYVNKKSFNLDKGPITLTNLKGESVPLSATNVYGNLLNVFFKYDSVLNIYNNSYTQADFINGILGTINDNTYGKCKLQLMSLSDEPTAANTSLQIIDYKLFTKAPEQVEREKAYRFKIGPVGGIVKEFNFSMELSTLAQAQALYQSQLNFSSILEGKEFESGSNAQLKDEAYTLFDLSYAKNSDGYFSVNEVEKEIVIQSAKKNKEKQETYPDLKPAPKKDEADKEAENLDEVIKKKSIKFRIGKENKTLIFLDKGLIQDKIKKEEKGSALTYLDITLAIDGMAGLSCGEYFQIDGIPEMYNNNGFFQITNVKQGIDDNGWKTTIEAGYRIDIEKIKNK